MGPHGGISAPTKEALASCLVPSAPRGHSKKAPSVNQEVCPDTQTLEQRHGECRSSQVMVSGPLWPESRCLGGGEGSVKGAVP